jgi:hypothetical protein
MDTGGLPRKITVKGLRLRIYRRAARRALFTMILSGERMPGTAKMALRRRLLAATPAIGASAATTACPVNISDGTVRGRSPDRSRRPWGHAPCLNAIFIVRTGRYLARVRGTGSSQEVRMIVLKVIEGILVGIVVVAFGVCFTIGPFVALLVLIRIMRDGGTSGIESGQPQPFRSPVPPNSPRTSTATSSNWRPPQYVPPPQYAPPSWTQGTVYNPSVHGTVPGGYPGMTARP